MLGVPLT